MMTTLTESAKINEYSDFEHMPLLSTYETPVEGVKFVIQGNSVGNFRFRFDPMEITEPYHENIADLFDNNQWKAKNGGWFKIIGNKVILFLHSRDLGIYNDDIAIKAAQKVFPNKEICSHSGKFWSAISQFYI